MSTRATYQFTAGNFRPAVCFYIHYDGYPEGAAEYLAAAMVYGNQRGGLPAAFIRANELAEFTDGHHGHEDTEFRWTITGDRVSGDKRTHTGWEGIFAGSLVEFVNEYSDGAPLAAYANTWWTEALLSGHVEGRIRAAAEAGGKGWTFDFRNRVEQARLALHALQTAFPGHDKASTYAAHLASLEALLSEAAAIKELARRAEEVADGRGGDS